MDQIEFNLLFKKRTIDFALSILKLYSKASKSDELRIIGKQLIRSSTSVGANFRAACTARSTKERFAKFCIVSEEANETIYWLELLQRSTLNVRVPEEVFKEAIEISKVMAACKKGVGRKLKQ